MSLLKLKKIANARQWNELDALWPDAITDPEADLDDLAGVVGQVWRLGAREQSESLLVILLAAWEERDGAAGRLSCARTMVEQLPKSALLRKELDKLLIAEHGEYEVLPGLMKILMDERHDLVMALSLVDKYVDLRPGGFLSDRSHLESGVVESVNPDTAKLTVSFNGRHQDLGPEQIADVIVLPPDHFPSLLLYRPDELRRIAAEDPIVFVTRKLESVRGQRCSFKDLKSAYLALEGEEAWGKWWRDARPILKKSARIELDGASQPTFRLLKEDRDYDDRQRELFRLQKTPVGKLQMVLDHLADAKREKALDSDLLVEFGNNAARMAGKLLKTDPAMTLACLAVHSEVAATGAPVVKMNPMAVSRVLSAIEEPAALNAALGDRLLHLVLKMLRRMDHESWQRIWSGVLLRSGRQTSELIARGLIESGGLDTLVRSLDTILDHPTASPDVMCWLWRTRYGDSKTSELLAQAPELESGRLLASMLGLADSLGRMTAVSNDKPMRMVLDQVLETLTYRDSDPIRAHVETLDADGARGLKAVLDGSEGIKSSSRNIVNAMLRARFPEIYHEAAKPWEEETNYTTESGLNRRQGELDTLVNEDLPAVARQIGEAAAHGDLSENAEYTAALEKRDQITSRATRIEAELSQAKVITPEMAASDFVNIGTRVTLRDTATGREQAYALLGVWDSDPDADVLSYKAPLAAVFMGHYVGEVVEYGEGEHRRSWEILKIEPAV